MAKPALTTTLRDAIVSGEYAPNQRLIEADLSASFGASRASVRTALLELSAEGLVDRLPNRGSRVRAIPLAEAIEILEVRMGLEGLCAAKAATHISESRDRRVPQAARQHPDRCRVRSLRVLAPQPTARPPHPRDREPPDRRHDPRTSARAGGATPVSVGVLPGSRCRLGSRARRHHRRDHRPRRRPCRSSDPGAPRECRRGAARDRRDSVGWRRR